MNQMLNHKTSSPDHLRIQDLNVWYGSQHALQGISASIPTHGITAIIGPSGCGKTTLLRSLNRLLEENEGIRISGEVWFNDINIYDRGVDVTEIRTRIGLLAPKPYPLPMSIYENVAYGRRIHGLDVLDKGNGRNLDRKVEQYLRTAGLWDEVKDRLGDPASALSTWQQQRLCLARTLAVEPEILLCDEPTSALDPISAQGIEEQLIKLKENTTIVLVTHMLRQASRLAEHVIFLWMGELIESGPAEQFFNDPRDPRTKEYLIGKIG
jgi:phosphate transport system ATP-binding protein